MLQCLRLKRQAPIKTDLGLARGSYKQQRETQGGVSRCGLVNVVLQSARSAPLSPCCGVPKHRAKPSRKFVREGLRATTQTRER